MVYILFIAMLNFHLKPTFAQHYRNPLGFLIG